MKKFKLNKGNIRRVAITLLRASMKRDGAPLGYNQRRYFSEGSKPDMSGHNCNTTACIAGWTTGIFTRIAPRNWNLKAFDVAKEKLGLTQRQANALFGGDPLDGEVTNNQAALVLFNLAETGKVDWKVAKLT